MALLPPDALSELCHGGEDAPSDADEVLGVAMPDLRDCLELGPE